MIIEQIRNIGEYVSIRNTHEDPLDAMLNKVEGDKVKSIVEINVTKDNVTYEIKDFRKDVVNEALFYQKGNGALGGGIRLDFYKESKVRSACDFCEVVDKVDKIKTIIETYIKERGNEAFAIILIDGKSPRELFRKKFLTKMYSTMYREVSGEHICHLCEFYGKAYNTTTLKFYTNDKGTYSNVEGEGKSGIVICSDCLNNIIIGKKHVDEVLKTYWSCLDSNVMFLPHTYNEKVYKIYKSTKINSKGESVKFLDKIRDNEQEVLDEVSKSQSVTDILFYEEQSKFFYIYDSIQSILPSFFSEVSHLLRKYNLSLYTIFNFTAAVKITFENIETSKKDKIKILDAIFRGKKISRNLFFKRVMNVYKHYFLKDEHRKFASMRTINRIYSLLCERNCLEKGCDVMQEYKDYYELFEKNTDYFNTYEKKAWFILGKTYNTMMFLISQRNSDGSADVSKTSLEKNFFYSRKFNFKDFVYFCALLEEKAVKYCINYPSIKAMMCEAKEDMAKKENKLSQDEAKYVFFWGFNSVFKKDKDDNKGKDEKNQLMEGK